MAVSKLPLFTQDTYLEVSNLPKNNKSLQIFIDLHWLPNVSISNTREVVVVGGSTFLRWSAANHTTTVPL